MCYRDDMSEIWLVCRYIQPKWPCGLHPDYITLQECTPNFMNSQYETKNRRYFYGTVLRNPVHRFLSEFRHIQRGASWEAAAPLCKGKLLMSQIPQCYQGKFWHDLTIEKFMSCPYNLALNRQTWMLSNISAIDCDFKTVLSNSHTRKKLLHIAKKNLESIAYFGMLEYPLQSQFIFEKTFDLTFDQPFQQWDTGFTIEFLKSYKLSDSILNKIKELNSLDVALYHYAKSIFFRKYNFFVAKYGKPHYKHPASEGKFAKVNVDKDRLKKNLPKSPVKEEILRKRREKERAKMLADGIL